MDVCDRGAGSLEFLDKEDALGRCYVVRAYQDRRARVGHADAGGALLPYSVGHVRPLPGHGRRVITAHGRGGKPNRRAAVRVAWAAVRLQPPRGKRGQYRGMPLSAWAVRVWEAGAPAGCAAVEWLLLTDVAVAAEESAWERADGHELRWVQEEWHKGLKTGRAVEAAQFTAVSRLGPMVA